jgi:hypothetical protein
MQSLGVTLGILDCSSNDISGAGMSRQVVWEVIIVTVIVID